MSFNTVLAQFQSILNRDDCSDTLATTFLTQALSQIEREARLPCMERALQGSSSSGGLQFVSVPSDFLQLQDIMVQSNNGSCYTPPVGDGTDVWIPLNHLSYRQLLRVPIANNPSAYARNQGNFVFAGWIPQGVPIQVLYYGQFTPITDPTLDNEATISIPDLMLYKALGSYAGVYFEHPQAGAWEALYQSLLVSANLLAADADMMGGPLSVAPSHGGYDGYDYY